jgi:pimeloyl-ACP methyl ester carboxylesterase
MPFANNQGIRIYYEDEGVGPPLALAHGFSSSIEDWRDYGYVELLKNDFHLILVDSRGHGKSDKPHNPLAYAPSLRVVDYISVLDDLGIDKVHFLGYSNGAITSLCAGKFAPNRFQSIIVGGMRPYKDSSRFKNISMPFEKPIYGLPDTPNPILELLNRGPEAWVAFWEQNIATPPNMRARLLAQDFDALRAEWQYPQDWRTVSEIEALLPVYPLPCLIYVGEADYFDPGAKVCAQEMPDATFVSFPERSHGDTMMRSDVVVPAVKKFLERFDQNL